MITNLCRFIVLNTMGLLFGSPIVFGQVNLVLNPSFEDTAKIMVHGSNNIQDALFWSSLDTTSNNNPICSPSYISVYNTDPSCHIPSNNTYFYQYPKSGNSCGYIELYYFDTWFGEYRNYAQGKLKNKLINNHHYCVSFYVNLADISTKAIDRIGAYFDDGTIDSISACSHPIPYIIPQIENPKFNFIQDTLNWVKVEGIFTSSGIEKFITIGNFYTNSTTGTINMPGWVIGPVASYLLDDVSVIDISEPNFAGNDTLLAPGCPVFIGHADDIGFTSEWTYKDSSSIISTHAGITVSDSSSKTYVVKMITGCAVLFDTITVSRDSSLKCIGVGIPQTPSKQEAFVVYPNPNNGNFTINYKVQQNNQFKLLNCVGQTIQVITPNNTQGKLELSIKYNGLLLIQLVDDKGKLLESKKLVINDN